MEELRQDIAFGARMLVKSPTFAVIAVLTLALGIGATTTIFSLVNAVLLRPLPFAQPDRLVALGQTDPRDRVHLSAVSYLNFRDWKTRSQSFETMAVFHGDSAILTTDRDPVRLRCAVASAGLLPMLGIAPTRGRLFEATEDEPGRGYSAIVSHALWQTTFGADPAMVGKTVTLNGKPFTVVGILPEKFSFPLRPIPYDIWITPAIEAERTGEGQPMTSRGYCEWEAIGRLKPGISLEAAQLELDGIAAALAGEYPKTNTDSGIRAIGLHDRVVGEIRSPLLLLLGFVACVLLIACANVANLLLARAVPRQKEIAIRTALGAGQGRILRQLLTESLLIAALGGTVGLALALAGSVTLRSLLPEYLPRVGEIGIDWRVLGFVVFAALATGILFGFFPAIASVRPDIVAQLKDTQNSASAGGGRAFLRRFLVVSEVAVSVVLLASAALLVQSFVRLSRVNPGFTPDNVLTAWIELTGPRYAEREPRTLFFQTLLDRVKAQPGVTSASLAGSLPLDGSASATGFDIEGQPTEPGKQPATELRIVALDCFTTLGMRRIAGRDFSATDTMASPRVLIVNESFARKFFPSESALGKRVKTSYTFSSEENFREIVGIVADIKQRSLKAETKPEVYYPYGQAPTASMALVVKTAGEQPALAAAIQGIVRELDRSVPVYGVKSLDQYLNKSIAEDRAYTLLLSVFAIVALVLAAIGLYGVMGYTVAQRTREIGIRMAIGAGRFDVLRLILGSGLALVGTGLGIGLVGAAIVTRLLESLLFGISASDPATFVGIALFLAAVGILACYIPARRAARVDPLVALRYD